MDAASITNQSIFAQPGRPDQLVQFPTDPEPTHVPTDVQRVHELLRGMPNPVAPKLFYLNNHSAPIPLGNLTLSQLRRGFTSLWNLTVSEFVLVAMTYSPDLVISLTCRNPEEETRVHYDTHGFSLEVSPRQVEVMMLAKGDTLIPVPVPGRDKVTLEIDLRDPVLKRMSDALRARYID